MVALECEELPEVTENRLQRRMLNMSFAALVNLLSVRRAAPGRVQLMEALKEMRALCVRLSHGVPA
ncbi:unnamed protein product [Effrenium voratum]|uniref:Uncharacterized protein n=1 Tax=Effrenium voratum TaxID=2562239 RepID=A0AA36JAS8_9DINO|nr:unnamed protein product [Effrenium voratum]